MEARSLVDIVSYTLNKLHDVSLLSIKAFFFKYMIRNLNPFAVSKILIVVILSENKTRSQKDT